MRLSLSARQRIAAVGGRCVFGLQLVASALFGATVYFALWPEDRGAQITTIATQNETIIARNTAAEQDHPAPPFALTNPFDAPARVMTQRVVNVPSLPDVTSSLGPAAVNPMTINASFQPNRAHLEDMQRGDRSMRVRIPLAGSLQNPAWSPDGRAIAFTRFRNGYNKGPADLYVFDLVTGNLTPVAADGSDNVSQPGSTWNARTGEIVFSSDRDGHEEIFAVKADSAHARPRKLTSRRHLMAYEPSLAPDGGAVVFETHDVKDAGKGRITMLRFDAPGHYQDLTDAQDDCRQPNWSPDGRHVLYQRRARGRWDIWLYDVAVQQSRPLTSGAGDKTDATFSPDGRFVLYSGEYGGGPGDNLLAIPVEGGRPMPVTRQAGYHGAPSWSPDGGHVIAEASVHAPDGSRGTEIVITPVAQPALLAAHARGGQSLTD